ncbi:MAG: histidinol-phosphatase [Ruminococcus sp.]|nr:histidinol-phosphatase [Ruminococcus sp.]
MQITDIHCHCLPGIDDGAKDIDESLQVLETMAKAGVERLVCTPHFYPHENTVERFVYNRNNAYEKLKPHLKNGMPKLYLGAEVLYSSKLLSDPNIHDLCLEGTDYLFLEMPYKKLTGRYIQGVSQLVDNMEVKILVVHIERYLNFTDWDSLMELMSLDVLGQINAKSLTSMRTRKYALKLLKDNYAQFLGSDMHNLKRGDITVDNAEKYLEKKIGDGFYKHVMHNCDRLFANKDIYDIR